MPHNNSQDYSSPWTLKFDNMLPDISWYWWWWMFFIENPKNPNRPKQLMILWSTKYTDDILVNDKRWSVSKLPVKENGGLEFDGMTAAWWFDGEDMYEPIVLDDMDFKVFKNGEKGKLVPRSNGADYRFFGSPDKYRVNIIDEENDFRFELTPWNDFLQKHRFKENYYTKKYSYNIMKIYGMKLKGVIEGKKVKGSGYFQRVNVNAPAMPWYWGLVHCETGSFIHYFNPFIGPQIFRTKKKQRSKLDFGDLSLSGSILFYHKETDSEFDFSSKSVDVRHHFEDDMPVFVVTGEDEDKRIRIVLKAYSRAYWRFQQPRKYGMKSILYYNEYPANLLDFEFEKKDGTLKVKKEDLGKTHANFEHTWGKMF